MALRIAPRLAWQVVDGETVVVDVEEGRMLGLDGVAACLWPLLESCDVAQLAEEVVRRFDVDLATARRDVAAFVEELRERRLIVTE